MPKSQDKCTHQYLVLEDVSEIENGNIFHYLCEACDKVFDFFEEKPLAEPSEETTEKAEEEEK